MQAVSDQLDTIGGLECFPYPPLTPPSGPAAIVSYPKIDYGETYRRGADSMDLPVSIVLPLSGADAKSTWSALGEYMASSGAKSVIAVLDAGAYVAFDTLAVRSATVDVVEIGGVDFLRAQFTVDITGSGA
jgi:hypothetical protein